jgi:hypothetical protein
MNKIEFDKSKKIVTSKSGPIKLKNRGFKTNRENPKQENQFLSSFKDKNKTTKVRLSKIRTQLKTKRVTKYKHPMSKWMQVAYASPKPMPNREYQELFTNYQKAAYEDVKKSRQYVIEKEVPFRVACEQHAHLLYDQKNPNYESLQEKRIFIFKLMLNR